MTLTYLFRWSRWRLLSRCEKTSIMMAGSRDLRSWMPEYEAPGVSECQSLEWTCGVCIGFKSILFYSEESQTWLWSHKSCTLVCTDRRNCKPWPFTHEFICIREWKRTSSTSFRPEMGISACSSSKWTWLAGTVDGIPLNDKCIRYVTYFCLDWPVT